MLFLLKKLGEWFLQRRRRSRLGTWSLDSSGKLIRILSPREKKVVRRIENKLLKKNPDLFEELVPFEEFFENIFRDAAKLSFKYRCNLWKYYQQLVFCHIQGRWDTQFFQNYGVYFAAIDTCVILSFAKKLVITNLTPTGKRVFDMDICQHALREAEHRGVQICIIPCKSYHCFSIWNEIHMSHHEEFPLGVDLYQANAYFSVPL